MSDEAVPTPESTPAAEEAKELLKTDTVEDVKQAIGDTVKDIVDKVEPTPAEKRKYKVKIDKEEREVDEEELIRNYQLRQASDKRFKEASEKEKLVEAILQMAKTDPKKALSHPAIGLDPRKLAEEWLAADLEEELMDPKEKELKKLRSEKAEIERQLKAREEEERSIKEQEQVAAYRAEYTKDIEAAVKASGLPYNVGVVNRVRDYMLQALEGGQPDIKASDIMPYVKKDFEADIKALFSASPAELMAEILGEEGLKKIRTWDMARLKNPGGKAPKEQAAFDKTRKQEAAKKTLTTRDYFESLREKFKDSRD
jgi:hypothetical protein